MSRDADRTEGGQAGRADKLGTRGDKELLAGRATRQARQKSRMHSAKMARSVPTGQTETKNLFASDLSGSGTLSGMFVAGMMRCMAAVQVWDEQQVWRENRLGGRGTTQGPG